MAEKSMHKSQLGYFAAFVFKKKTIKKASFLKKAGLKFPLFATIYEALLLLKLLPFAAVNMVSFFGNQLYDVRSCRQA